MWKISPKMQRPEYYQMYTAFYVLTLCCCFSANAHARTINRLTIPQGVQQRSAPISSFNENVESLRLLDTLNTLENILETMEMNKQAAAASNEQDIFLGQSGSNSGDLDDGYDDESILPGRVLGKDGSISSSRSLSPSSASSSFRDSNSDLMKRLVGGGALSADKRKTRPCYWNVVSCYGK